MNYKHNKSLTPLASQAKLVIEIDRGQHFQSANIKHDEERARTLKTFGLEVVRFNNHQVEHHFDAVCNEIDIKIQEKIAGFSRKS